MVVVRFLVVVLGLFWSLSLAQDQGDFIVAYEDSSSEVHVEYANMLQQRQFLESLVSSLNTQIALPYDIGVVGAQCDEVNAYWAPDTQTVIICYELFEYLSEVFRAGASSPEELDNEVLGATEFIFYHELGHALIDTFSIPFTGREEDAVDQFSSIILMNQGKASSAIAGASFFFASGEALSQSGVALSDMAFWDEHSLDQQRFYDIACLVYGSDPETYDFLLLREDKGFLLSDPSGYLPKERADRCFEEYKDISNSWDTLISLYVPAIGGSTEPSIEAAPEPTTNVTDVIATGSYDETFKGELLSGDSTLDEGQFFDSYELELVQGQEVTFELSSTEFDTYLIVSAPDDFGYINDDATIKVDGYFSKLTIPINTTGTWLVGVSSYEAGQSGSYNVGIIKQEGVYNEVLSETLAEGDSTYETGEYVDSFEYTFEAGQNARVVLSSLDFDTYLVVTTPSGETIVNDDFENQFGMARVDFEVVENGVYTISATTYEVGEVGPYQLAISTNTSSDTATALFSDSQQGILAVGDSAFDSGEFYDSYSYDFTVGQTLILDAVSTEFDTYIMAVSPSEQQFFNDNYNTEDPSKMDAGLDIVVEEAGTWTVLVSSSKVGEVGNYSLLISDIGDGTEEPLTDAGDVENTEATTDVSVDVTDMTTTKARSTNLGRLESGDNTLDDGSYVDYYLIDLVAGQEAIFSVVSADFETYIGVMKPSGEMLELDEQQDTSRSRITLNVEEAGTWFVFVTSVSAGQEGNYLLSIKK